MKNKIKNLEEIVVEFVTYLESPPGDAQDCQIALTEIIRQNALDTINKLKKLHKLAEANPEPSKTLEKRVYTKLIEYISRVQEAVQSCLYREYLAYKANETDSQLDKYKVLKTIGEKLVQVLPLSSNVAMNPEKHWLSEQWKKADAGLQMQTAINVLKTNPDDLLETLFKTVVFSEMQRQAVTKTTRKTVEFTKANPKAENEINTLYYKSISAFEWALRKRAKL